MGAAHSCDIHGSVGINFTCTHIAKNIAEGKNEKCMMVKIRIYPKKNAESWEKDITHKFEIPVCLQCYEDKSLSKKMKVENDREKLKEIEDKYDIETFCAVCISEYGQRNSI